MKVMTPATTRVRNVKLMPSFGFFTVTNIRMEAMMQSSMSVVMYQLKIRH